MNKNKNAKKKRTPTAKLLSKLTPAQKRERAKKLKYVTLKTKLEKAGLWKTYLKAKKDGVAGRGSSVDLMRKLATEGLAAVMEAAANVEKLPTETNTKMAPGERISIRKTFDEAVAKPSLVALASKLEALDKERAAVASRLRELLG